MKNASAALVISSLPIGNASVAARSKTRAADGFELKEGDSILFIGDSITDGSRQREYYRQANSIRSLGNGYVQLIACKLNYMFPEKGLKIYNTGINGDTIAKIMARLDTDCIKLNPTVVSILIGVNDYNREFTKKGHADPELYENEYRTLLTTIREALPGVRFIIGEPYALKGVRDVVDAWWPGFEQYQAIARKLAEEYNAPLVPYQAAYEALMPNAPGKHYSTDGVHPSLAGIRLMSDCWFDNVNPR